MKFADIPALQVPNLNIVQGSVASVDCERKFVAVQRNGTETRKSYDCLIAATGLRRVFPVVPQSLTTKTYLSECGEQIAAIKASREAIVVVGGGMYSPSVYSTGAHSNSGAVGIEMASELKLLNPEKRVRLIHSRDKLLSSEPLPDDFKNQTLSLLEESGVEVLLSHRVTDVTKHEESPGNRTVWNITFSDGSLSLASRVIWAISKAISTSTYLPAEAINQAGLVEVDSK